MILVVQETLAPQKLFAETPEIVKGIGVGVGDGVGVGVGVGEGLGGTD